MALNLKTLGTRALSALFFVIILVGCICWSYLSFSVLFFVVALLGLREYYQLAEKLEAKPEKVLGFIFAILLLLFFMADPLMDQLHLHVSLRRILVPELIFLFPFILLIKALFTDRPSTLTDALHTFLGVVYAVFPLALLSILPLSFKESAVHYDYFKVLGIVFLIWSNDTMAYLGGSLFGKHKMYARISPGKTWEGTIIGAVSSIGIGFLLNLNHTYSHDFIWPCIGLMVGLFGTIGDLVESMLKRMAAVKDSGSLMPGHGGALDRFDSLIFVTPFVFAFLRLVA